MNMQQEHSDIQQENERLRLEIANLKESLEKEEFLHKTLYKQWSQLHALILSKESELKLYKSTNSLYKYSFYLILLLIAPAYYFFSKGNEDEKVISASPNVPSPAPSIKEMLTANLNTLQLSNVKLKEKEVFKTDTIKPKIATINKPVIDKLLTDSIRNFVYWEGWSAYYEKSKNPYQKSSEKYEVWLKGWKEGENDAKKIFAKNSIDSLH